MKLATYPFIKRPESFYYEFYSQGPNGSIKKVVEYYRFQELTIEAFNVAFGDWDFQPFFRAEEKNMEQGFGLGLSPAQQIIKVHKGQISFESIIAKGSTFMIVLPSAGGLLQNK